MAERKCKIKMTDVAREVGVSTTVVSRVLNGLQGVNAATRERVLAAIRTLGYQPDPRGRRQKPASDRHRRILTLLIGNSLERLPPVYLEVISGIGSGLSEQDYTMELKCVMADEELDVDRLASSLDGMIFFGALQPFDSYRRLSQRLPVVEVMGEFMPLDSWDHVSYDNQAIGPLAARYLLERGHLNCAVITPSVTSPSLRAATFKTAVEAGGGSVREYHLAHWNPGVRLDLGNRATGPERVTGIFAVGDNMLKCIYTGLRHHQLQVGRDVDLVSCNREYPLLQDHTPLPAEIDIHPEQVGRRAVRQLFWRLEHPLELSEKVTLAIELLPPERVAKLMHEHAAHVAATH